jgi:transcriptional regulator with XRE-family HTH domain
MVDKNARKIRAFLVGKGITQAQIARDMGLARSTINRWISGGVQSQRVFEYFLTLGCPREYMVGRPEARRAA